MEFKYRKINIGDILYRKYYINDITSQIYIYIIRKYAKCIYIFKIDL